jgi:hypothetical protein
LALVVEEPKCFVLDDGSTDGSAKIVAGVRIFGSCGSGIEEVTGPESGVAPEPVSVSVIVVGAAARKDLHDRAVVAAIFWGKIAGYDAEFLSGVRVQRVKSLGRSRYFGVVIIDAVEKEVVIALACAVHGKTV